MNKVAAKIPALSSDKIDKCDYLAVEEMLCDSIG